MKITFKKKLKAALAATSLIFVAFFLSASVLSAKVDLTEPEEVITPQIQITNTGELYGIFEGALTTISYIFWIVAVGFIFYAAYIYLVAGGDPEKVKKASQQLWWAVIAIAVALMATVLPFFVQSFLSGDYFGPGL